MVIKLLYKVFFCFGDFFGGLLGWEFFFPPGFSREFCRVLFLLVSAFASCFFGGGEVCEGLLGGGCLRNFSGIYV